MTTVSRFLKKFTIQPENVPAYVDFNTAFSMKLDREIGRLILESDDPRINKRPQMKETFRKTYDLIDPKTNVLNCLYRPRFGLGRRYAEQQENEFYVVQGRQVKNENFGKYWGSLTIHSKYIKNTIFHYLGWRDYDQRKGHPTILCELGRRNHIKLEAYSEYIKEGAFEVICEEMIDYYSYEPRKSEEELAELTDEQLKTYNSSRLTESNIKDLFNKTIYGGGHPKWCDEITHTNLKPAIMLKLARKGKLPIELKNKNTPFPFWNKFYEDTKLITGIIWSNNIALRQIVCKGMIDDSNEPFSKCRNKLMSHFCGILENELTFRAYKYRVENGLCPDKSVDWGYDGFTTPPPPAHTDHEFHIKAMNDYVREKTGFLSVCFVEKEFKKDTILWSVIEARRLISNATPVIAEPILLAEGIEEDNGEDNDLNGIIEDDNDGAELIYDLIKDRFKFCCGNIFFKQTNIWINSKQTVDSHLLHFILTKTNLQKMSGGKSPSPKPYSTNVSGAKALREALYAKLIVEGEDNTLLQKFITTTRGKLCFLDGVLDLTYIDPDTKAKGKFYVWDATYEGEGEERVCSNEGGYVDFPYYTPVQIERKFAEYFKNPNLETMKFIKREIFSNLFGVVDCEKALAFFARGVAGHFEDKAWSLYIGNRNCGKGVVDTLCKSALGQYHATVEAQNLLCNSSRTLKQEQPEKQMAFAMDFQFARLTFSQELPPPSKNKNVKINADIIKKLNSGGDPLKGKRNYDIYITEFINQSRLIVMANDCPPLTNDDALQTCCEFNSTISFKTKEEIAAIVARGEDELILQQYKVGDPFIKDKCKTDEWSDSFIMLMVEAYQSHAVPCVDKNEENCEDNGDTDNVNLRKFIITTFEITNNPEDFLHSSSILEIFETRNYGDISAKKIAIELNAIGLKGGKKGGQRGWTGIKKREVVEPVKPVD
jgi:hypothetical protein